MIPRLREWCRRIWWRLVGAPEPEIHGGLADPALGGDPLGGHPYDPRFPVS